MMWATVAHERITTSRQLMNKRLVVSSVLTGFVALFLTFDTVIKVLSSRRHSGNDAARLPGQHRASGSA